MPTVRRSRLTVLPLPLLAAAGLAGAALPTADADAAVQYKGKTSRGARISFTLAGSRVSGIDTLVPAACLSPRTSMPKVGVERYYPPGSSALGRESKRKARQRGAMHYGEVTKNYRFRARRSAGGAIS